MKNLTAEQPVPADIPPEDYAYAENLYAEGLDIANPELRDEHFKEVAELVGDIALYEALGERVTADRERVQTNLEAARTMRASTAARNIEEAGFAEKAPAFIDQIRDQSRQTPFRFAEDAKHDSIQENQHETSELEGLQDLYGFLSVFLKESRTHDGEFKYPDLAAQAESMLDNLTFIGEKEYQEAALGLAFSWKSYLDEDPQRQLCVLANISNSEKYPGQRKSDDYLRDRILQTFSDEELEKYSGRIVKDVADITADPEHTRIVLLDDWSITGTQIRRVYNELMEDEKFETYKNAHCVEVNLLASSEERIKNGLAMDDEEPPHDKLKVRAYYKAHRADVGEGFGYSHISGLHSAVNYGFEEPINKGMVKVLGKLGKLKQGKLPIALANIVRPYREVPAAIDITADKLTRAPKGLDE